MYFKSVKGALNLGKDILSGSPMRGKKAGMFAAVVTFIKGIINFLPSLFLVILAGSLAALLGSAFGGEDSEIVQFLVNALAGGAAMGLFVGIVVLFNDILAGILLIKLNNALEDPA